MLVHPYVLFFPCALSLALLPLNIVFLFGLPVDSKKSMDLKSFAQEENEGFIKVWHLLSPTFSPAVLQFWDVQNVKESPFWLQRWLMLARSQSQSARKDKIHARCHYLFLLQFVWFGCYPSNPSSSNLPFAWGKVHLNFVLCFPTMWSVKVTGRGQTELGHAWKLRATADDREERKGTGLKTAESSRNLMMALKGCRNMVRGMVRSEESRITSPTPIP